MREALRLLATLEVQNSKSTDWRRLRKTTLYHEYPFSKSYQEKVLLLSHWRKVIVLEGRTSESAKKVIFGVSCSSWHTMSFSNYGSHVRNEWETSKKEILWTDVNIRRPHYQQTWGVLTNRIFTCNSYLCKCKDKLSIKCLNKMHSNKRMNITRGFTLKDKREKLAHIKK